jgi:hypothetical protein
MAFRETPPTKHGPSMRDSFDAARTFLDTLRAQHIAKTRARFVAMYGEDTVERDESVARIKCEHEINSLPHTERRGYMLAKILESHVVRMSNSRALFGAGTHVRVPYLYDDAYHGVDLFIDWEKGVGREPLTAGIKIDATHGTESAAHKLQKIKELIVAGAGNLGAKYHSSTDGTSFGSKWDMPAFVIGCNESTVLDVETLFHISQTHTDIKKKNEAVVKYSSHEIRPLFRSQIIEQATYFSGIARKHGNEQLAYAYEEVARRVSEHHKKRGRVVGNELKNDAVNVALHQWIETEKRIQQKSL